MITLLSPHYVVQAVTEDDMIIASLACGFTIGFGWLTTWTAAKQTRHIFRRGGSRVFRNPYVWMIWLEILVCLIFSIICFLHLKGIIPPSFAFYFAILTTWALQVQFLLQIIINRCSILIDDKQYATRLKIGVAVLITAVNITVYTIWIPARLQISERYIWVNEWWDRVEKTIYLFVDGSLNVYFIVIVQRTLVAHGLTKYRSLVKFNMCIIGFSLSMDIAIISMMSLKNTFVYMQFHPLAYMVKLKIELSMADLIRKVAKKPTCGIISAGTFSHEEGAAAEFATKSLASYNRNRRTLTSGTDDISEVVSLELQEMANDTTNSNTPREIVSDGEKASRGHLSSSLQAGVAISNTHSIRATKSKHQTATGQELPTDSIDRLSDEGW